MKSCRYMPRKSTVFPCSRCENKDATKCKEFGGYEPITCKHCRYYNGFNRNVCYKRKGYNIRPCEEFDWS